MLQSCDGAENVSFIPERIEPPFAPDRGRKLDSVPMDEKQNVAEEVGRLIGEIFSEFGIRPALTAAPRGQPHPGLRQLAQFLLHFQDEPVVVSGYSVRSCIGFGCLFKKAGKFLELMHG